MLVYIYESLRGFRKVFSHHSSWLVFSVLVLGFIGSSEIAGVSSFLAFRSHRLPFVTSFFSFRYLVIALIARAMEPLGFSPK